MTMPGQIQLSTAQTKALVSLAAEYLGSEGMLLTAQSQGDIYVAFPLASFTITWKGDVQEEEFG
jgi:hypothetical protein